MKQRKDEQKKNTFIIQDQSVITKLRLACITCENELKSNNGRQELV